MKVTIDLPARMKVADYHDFRFINENLKQLNSKIKVIEVGGVYIGMAYVGSLKDPDNKKLLAELKQECKEEDEEFFEGMESLK